jgi:hypothetical protein
LSISSAPLAAATARCFMSHNAVELAISASGGFRRVAGGDVPWRSGSRAAA